MHDVTSQRTKLCILFTLGTSNIIRSYLLQEDCFDSSAAIRGCYPIAIFQCINLGRPSYVKAFTTFLYPLPCNNCSCLVTSADVSCHVWQHNAALCYDGDCHHSSGSDQDSSAILVNSEIPTKEIHHISNTITSSTKNL
jgi:hypothetical protein